MLLRTVLVAISLTLGSPAFAQVSAQSSGLVSGNALKEMLGKASDSALDRLSRPGAFSADDAIRIALPGAGKGVGDLMSMTSKAGLTGDINGSLNRAAEAAASQAKPIFRAAINKVSFSDAVGILRGGNTGATDYLKKSTGGEIRAKLLPLIRAALEKTGVLKQASQLKAFGMDEAKLIDYVAGKTSDGIFTYVGREETKARQDPIGTAGALLKGLKF
ncbi:MAG: DUF4197 domain-containing protein [Burkholderiaceae bacterium]